MIKFIIYEQQRPSMRRLNALGRPSSRHRSYAGFIGSNYPIPSPITSSSSDSQLCTSITPSLSLPA